MPHITKLHLTTLDERSKAGRKWQPATGSEHLLVGMKIAIPVLPSIVISDDTRLPAFSNRKFQSEKSLILAISHLPVLIQLHHIKKPR